jgi:uncharacterized protein
MTRKLCIIPLFCGVLMTVGIAAFMYGKRALANRDYAATYKQLAPLAEQGNAQSQYAIANMLSGGLGVAVDKPQAVKWYRLAAEQGYAPAEVKLSMAYDYGDGVPRDLKEWAKWNQRAADHGVPFAQLTQGAIYWVGDGVARDKIQAYKWFTLCINADGRCALRRADVAKGMTPSQISEAERLAKDWNPNE